LNDDVEAALAEIDSAMAPWPVQPFSTHHFGAFAAGLVAHAYKSEGYLPWQERFEASSANAFLMRTPACRVSVLSSRAFALLATAARVREQEVEALLARTDVCTRELSKVPSVIAPGLAELQWATLSAARGQREEALRHARTAQTQLRDMLFAHGARYAEGLILGGAEGAAKRQQTRAWLEEQGFRNPERALRVILPGVELLHARLG
jgi:hypothetical protein